MSNADIKNSPDRFHVHAVPPLCGGTVGQILGTCLHREIVRFGQSQLSGEYGPQTNRRQKLAPPGSNALEVRETQNAGQRAKKAEWFPVVDFVLQTATHIIPNSREARFPSPTGRNFAISYGA